MKRDSRRYMSEKAGPRSPPGDPTISVFAGRSGQNTHNLFASTGNLSSFHSVAGSVERTMSVDSYWSMEECSISRQAAAILSHRLEPRQFLATLMEVVAGCRQPESQFRL